MTIAFTDLLPLRTTADLGQYAERLVLPRVYGRCALSPLPYDGTRRLWLVADHVIQGVDRVELDGREISAWALHQDTDQTGRPVAVLETQVQVEDARALRVEVRGAVHPVSGGLLERPDQVLWDLLVNVAGMGLAAGRLDDLRHLCGAQRIGGVLGGDQMTVQAALDTVCQGAGLAWSWASDVLAMPWPPAIGEAAATLTRAHSPRLSSACDCRARITRVELAYDYDWAAGDSRASLTLAAPDIEREEGGPVLARIDAPWLHGARDAIALATRYLQWHARPIWAMSATAPTGRPVSPGSVVAISHPHSPIPAGVLMTRARVGASESWEIAGPQGDAPDVGIVGTAGAVALDALEGPLYQYVDGLATWLITDDEGLPMPGVLVTLDGGVRRTTDGAGYVQFQGVQPGPHTLLIQPAGGQDFEPRTVSVSIA